jgi:hypothetical protein
MKALDVTPGHAIGHSLIVKSPLRATKSTAGPAMRLFSGSTATLAPMADSDARID